MEPAWASLGYTYQPASAREGAGAWGPQGSSVRGVHTKFAQQFPTEFLYSNFFMAANEVRNPLDPPELAALAGARRVSRCGPPAPRMQAAAALQAAALLISTASLATHGDNGAQQGVNTCSRRRGHVRLRLVAPLPGAIRLRRRAAHGESLRRCASGKRPRRRARGEAGL